MQRRSPQIVLFAVFMLVFAAACGASSGATTASTTKPTASSALPFKATFSAPSHHPVVNKNWPITVTVSNPAGKPIAATLQMNVLFQGAQVGQIDNGKIYHFVGRHHELITWPPASIGQPLTLQSVVTVNGAAKKLLWTISVVRK